MIIELGEFRETIIRLGGRELMYEKVIEASRQEVLLLLKEQGGILKNLLETPELLSWDKVDNQKRNLNKNLVELWLKTITEESYKIKRLETTIAVVGTMKSGKSTIINAIVGAEVMPKRNQQPMTTLPTLIRHVPGKKQPTLTFPKTEPYDKAIDKLKKVLGRNLNCQNQDHFVGIASKDYENLVHDILDDSFPSIQRIYEGPNAIFNILKFANDISRLCENLKISSPLKDYNDIREFPFIEVEFFHLRNTDNFYSKGTFTLIDTPGLNEAGQKYLKRVLAEQLEKASAVLAVMDYTQLNAEANVEVRTLLKEVIEHSGDRTFILVNKFDEKERHGMDENEVKSYVTNLLDESLDLKGIYPISSNWAYLANCALNELYTNAKLPNVNEAKWVEDFGKEAFGRRWEKCIDNYEEVQDGAKGLWEESLFDTPLNTIILDAFNRSVFISLEASIAKMISCDQQIVSFLNLRNNALIKSVIEIEEHIKALEIDVTKLEFIKKDSYQMVAKSIRTLSLEVSKLFSNSRKALLYVTKELFRKGKLQEQRREEDHLYEQNKTNKNLINNYDFGIKHLVKINFNPYGPNKFSTREESKNYLAKFYNEISNYLKPDAEKLETLTSYKVSQMEKSISTEINTSLHPIMKAAQERLQGIFSVTLNFPELQIKTIDINFSKIQSNASKEKTVSRTGTNNEQKWYTAWLYQHSIYTPRIGNKILHNLNANHKMMEEQLNRYVENKLSKHIDDYFRDMSDYLEGYRGDLIDSLKNKRLESDKLEELQGAMELIARIAADHNRDVEVVKEAMKEKYQPPLMG